MDLATTDVVRRKAEAFAWFKNVSTSRCLVAPFETCNSTVDLRVAIIEQGLGGQRLLDVRLDTLTFQVPAVPGVIRGNWQD